MKNPILILGGILICSISLPIIISFVSYKDIDNNINLEKKPIKQEIQTKKTKEIINYETVNKEAPIINVYNHKLGINQSMNIEQYLYGVLSGEMSADFDIEALKAQALAARTYVAYKQKQGNQSAHKGAVVCTDYKHCQEYKSESELEKSYGKEWMEKSYPKIKQAVDETKGQIITYQGEPIVTLYFSTSSGKTENNDEVFSANYPYLKSVDSPYDKIAPKYTSSLRLTNEEFVNHFKSSYNNINLNEYNLSNQVKVIKRSEAGSVEFIKIGNKELKGTDVRSVLNLNSANFEMKFDGDYVDISVKGYGHGVGMSQWGAQGMAQEGYKYYEILSHYYTGTTITDTY